MPEINDDAGSALMPDKQKPPAAPPPAPPAPPEPSAAAQPTDIKPIEDAPDEPGPAVVLTAEQLAANEVEAAKNVLRNKPRVDGNHDLSGCTAYLVRAIGVDQTRAAAIMVELEQAGFITAANADGKRNLL